jgi:hypothetical protein
MSIPGFAAEASLFKSTQCGTRGVYQKHFSRGSLSQPATIAPQQGPLGLEMPGTGFFTSRCLKGCFADQTRARLECIGRCDNFVGRWSPHFRGCIRECQRGVDVYVDKYVLPGAAELQPGYCERRCLRLERIPPFFVRA